MPNDLSKKLRRKVFRFYSMLSIVSFLYFVGANIIVQKHEKTVRAELVKEHERLWFSLSDHLLSKLNEIDHTVKVLSGSPWIINALSLGGEGDLDKANNVLIRYNTPLGNSVCYILNRQGVVIGSSNSSTPDSFLGKDYHFRPYFTHALKGVPYQYYAVGVTSQKRGYYASYPVYDGQKNIIGVAVIKRELDDFEKFLAPYEYCFLVSPDGVIFLSNKPEYALRTLWVVPRSRQKKIVESKQYGRVTFHALVPLEPGYAQDIRINNKQYISLSHAINDQGWMLSLFVSTGKNATARYLGWLIAGGFWGVVISTFIILFYIRRAAAILRRKEDRFNQVALASQDWIWEIDVSGRYAYSNQAVSSILGYDVEEIEGKSFGNFIEPGALEDMQKLIRAREVFFSVEVKRVKKDGTVIICESTGVPVLDSLKNFMGFRGVDRDVSVQRKADAALRESRTRLSVILDNLQAGVVVVDAQTRHIVDINRKAADMIGLPREDILEKVCHRFICPADENACPVLDLNQDINISERQLLTVDGRSIPILKTVTKIYLDGRVCLIGSFIDLSERKKAEAAVLQAQQRYAALVDNLNIGVYRNTAGSPGRFLEVNPAFVSMFEAESKEQILAMNVSAFYQDPSERQVFSEKLMRAGFVRNEELRLKTVRGRPLIASVSAVKKIDEDGEVYYDGTIEDISQRKEAEDKITHAARDWSETFDSITDLISVQDKDFRILKVNKACAQALKVAPQELIGKKCFEVFHGTNHPWDTCPHARTLEQQAGAIEEFFEPSLGKYLQVSTSPLFNDGHEIIGSVHIAKDITGRKKAEALLYKTQELYRLLAENITDIVWISDAQGKLIYVGPSIERLLGFQAKTVVYESLGMMFTPDSLNAVMSAILEGMAAYKVESSFSRRFDVEYIHKDGRLLWYEIELTVFYDTSHEQLHVLGVSRNISESKKSQEALRIAYHDLKEAQQQLIQSSKMSAMGQMAAGVSHEINQPLTGIRGFAQEMLMELEKNMPVSSDDLKKIIQQADRIDRIIKNIRFFSRKADFVMAKINIAGPVNEALDLLESQMRLQSVALQRKIPDSLPYVLGDSNQIQQVMVNLVTNARDAIAAAGRTECGMITVSAGVSADGEAVELAIADNGCGITKEHLGYLCNPFFTTKGPDRGMGLGLSIVYRIVEEHKGTISFDSDEHMGTTVRITLPIAEDVPA